MLVCSDKVKIFLCVLTLQYREYEGKAASTSGGCALPSAEVNNNKNFPFGCSPGFSEGGIRWKSKYHLNFSFEKLMGNWRGVAGFSR